MLTIDAIDDILTYLDHESLIWINATSRPHVGMMGIGLG
jgi:hypothetical protein